MSNPLPDNFNELSKEQLIELLKAFQELVKSPDGKKLLRNPLKELAPQQITDSSMLGKRALSMPYYKERFGLELKQTADAMLSDGKNRVYRYRDFKHLSKSSLYLRISQGLMYLVDKLDTIENKYKTLANNIELKKMDDGVHLEFIEKLGEAQIAEDIEAPIKDREWKIKLEDFLTNGKVNTKLTLKELNLDEEDIEEANQILFGLEDQLMFRISKTEILVVKFDPEKPPEL